jgi:hypothetical protein
MNLFWDYSGSPDEHAEVYAWIAANDCADIDIIGITENVVTAFRAGDTLMVNSAAEMRHDHASLSAALTAAAARLRVIP